MTTTHGHLTITDNDEAAALLKFLLERQYNDLRKILERAESIDQLFRQLGEVAVNDILEKIPSRMPFIIFTGEQENNNETNMHALCPIGFLKSAISKHLSRTVLEIAKSDLETPNVKH